MSNERTKILVVDDDLEATRMLKFGLEVAGGYEVREENDSRCALTVAREFRPDLIVLDVCMPEMDGTELALRFRHDRLFHTTPIVFLTSILSREEAGAAGLARGGTHFMAKPINLRELMAHIETAVPVMASQSRTFPG